jgi:hypothetical protein
LAAGVGGDEAVLGGVDGGEVQHGGRGVGGDAGAARDLQLIGRTGADGSLDNGVMTEADGHGARDEAEYQSDQDERS